MTRKQLRLRAKKEIKHSDRLHKRVVDFNRSIRYMDPLKKRHIRYRDNWCVKKDLLAFIRLLDLTNEYLIRL